MGIPGLLKQVNPLITKENLYALARGKRVGVDGHVWLHQLAYGFAQCIVVDKDYGPLAKEFLQRAISVQSQGVDLLFVFDGAPTPAKGETDQARQVRRARALSKLEHEAEPDPKTLRAAISLGWSAVEAVLIELRKYGLPYVVAPYEADAELSLLSRKGEIYAAATVDSDFIVHGISNIFFKVCWRSGRCHFYQRSILENPARWPRTNETTSTLLSLVKQAGLEVLLCFGLLVGCDYGTKIKGVGGKTAAQILDAVVARHGVELLRDAERAVDALATSAREKCNSKNIKQNLGSDRFTCLLCTVATLMFLCAATDMDVASWKEKAATAITDFRHALAYDPERKQVVTASAEHNQSAVEKWPFLGSHIPDSLAEARALGAVSPAGATVELPDVDIIRTASMAYCLTEDMIPGAHLPPLPWEHGFNP
eukprot:scaffold487612_cov19-Prasinocladus_malaysianus.AAC.1